MFLGHFAVALSAKKAAPKVSIGSLSLAAQLADLFWPAFLLLGWEEVRIVPGATHVAPLDFISYPYSHSLMAQLLWGVGLGSFYFVMLRVACGAVILAAYVPSHWLLDYISHRPDMPLIPGGRRYGLGLWNSLPATLTVELALFAIGIAVYLTVTSARDRFGQWALAALLIFLLLAYVGSVFGPPPPSEHVVVLGALAIWLTVPWAAWADHHRSTSVSQWRLGA